MEMLLLSHKVALELTLSTQHKGYGLSQREGWGDPQRLRVCKKGLGTLAIALETTTFN
jgi:hypothetical protein